MIRYGDLALTPLPEGRFTVGTDKRFVPHREGDAFPRGTLFVSVCPFLVRTPEGLLLLDTGLGEYAHGRDTSFLTSALAAAGVAPEDVTHVLLSHLHFDHSGGAVSSVHGEDRPTFPRAEYVVQRAELDAPYSGVSEEARDRVAACLDRAGQLAPVDGDGWLTDAIEYECTGGHTRDHQLFRLHTGGRTALFGGDVLPSPGQVGRRFQAKYDYAPAVSLEWRERIAAEAAAGGHLLLFYHSVEAPAGFVEEGPRGGYRVASAAEVPG